MTYKKKWKQCKKLFKYGSEHFRVLMKYLPVSERQAIKLLKKWEWK